MKYIKYLWYIIKHKFYVMIECFKIGLIWEGILHDCDKFLPSMFIPYANYFYGNKDKWKDRLNIAWNSHQKRNKHHYQYWILTNDNGEIILLDIPDKYLKEMICDWKGAGKAITGKNNIKEWWKKTANEKLINISTKIKIDKILGIYK